MRGARLASGLTVLAALTLADLSAAQTRKEQSWLRLDSSHFTFFSMVSERQTAAQAASLETFRALLSALTPGRPAFSPRPTLVYVFKSDASFKPYWPLRDGKPRQVASYFSPERDASYISLEASGGPSALKSLYTAFAYDFLNANHPRLPRWLRVGLAEFYGTFQIEKETLKVGLPDESNLDALRGVALFPLEELFAVERDSSLLDQETTWRRFNAQSWLVTHYLLAGGRRPGQLEAFIELLRQGAAREQAFLTAFGGPASGLISEVNAYHEGFRFFYGKIARSQIPVDESYRLSDVSWDEMLGRLGDLLLAHERSEEATDHYRLALSIRGDQARAHAGLGVVEYKRENYEAALEHLGRAVDLDQGDHRSQLYYGMALGEARTIEPGWWQELSDENRQVILQRRSAFERCIELEPEMGLCHSELGGTYFRDRDPAAGIAAYQRAIELEPERNHALMNLLRLAKSAGKHRVLEDTLKRYAERLDGEEHQEALSLLSEARVRAADWKLSEGDVHSALDLLTQAAAETPDPTEKMRINERILQLKGSE